MQKGEFYVSCKGPTRYELLLKRSGDYLTQFSYEDQHLSVIKMEATTAENLIKSGDRYAFVYEVEGRLCRGDEKTLRQPRNFLVDVETTHLYLVRLPAQSVGVNPARISLLNNVILPASIQVARKEPVAPPFNGSGPAFANYPGQSVGGRSPEKQQQIDAAVEAARRARMQQEVELGAAAAGGADQGADAASRIFNPSYNTIPNPY
jgi:hypothetical protein